MPDAHVARGIDPSEGAGRVRDEYDPFVRGPFPVGVRTFQVLDHARRRPFPCEVWYPAAARHTGWDLAPETQDAFAVPLPSSPWKQMAVRDAAAYPGTYPTALFSHHSGGHRRAATFLCTHLSSHGYVVAALDHSETVVADLARRSDETVEQKAARFRAVIASRVPDVRFLLDQLLDQVISVPGVELDAGRVAIVGHSFGGWTALAAPDAEPRIRAIVALAPGGASQRKPGILPVTLAFAWGRDVPTLYLAAENDVSLPLAGIHELFERTPATKQMVILRRADHLHFVDRVEEMHEMVRHMNFPGELAWIPREMQPVDHLCSGVQAQLFVQGLGLAHLDATLKQRDEAEPFLAGDLEAALATRGVEASVAHPRIHGASAGSSNRAAGSIGDDTGQRFSSFPKPGDDGEHRG